MAGRTTAAEKRKRISLIIPLLLAGKGRSEILQFASDMGWGLSDRTVESYVAAAREEIKVAGDAARDYEYGLARSRLESQYAVALEAGDGRLALAILREINALAALHQAPAPQRFQFEGVKPEVVELALSELADLGIDANEVFSQLLYLLKGKRAENE